MRKPKKRTVISIDIFSVQAREEMKQNGIDVTDPDDIDYQAIFDQIEPIEEKILAIIKDAVHGHEIIEVEKTTPIEKEPSPDSTLTIVTKSESIARAIKAILETALESMQDQVKVDIFLSSED